LLRHHRDTPRKQRRRRTHVSIGTQTTRIRHHISCKSASMYIVQGKQA
jgi:hypothetical protein